MINVSTMLQATLFSFSFQIFERKTAVLFCAYQYRDGHLHKYLQVDAKKF